MKNINLTLMRIESKVIAIFFSIIALTFAFHYRLNQPAITDPSVKLTHYTPQQLTKLHKSVVEITTGMHIKNFSEFDILKPKFVFDGIVWFIFDPLAISPDIVERFSIEKAEIIHKSEPKTKVVNNKLFVFYEIKVEITSDLNYELFPFDNHILAIQLTNSEILPAEVRLTSNSTLLITPSDIHTKDWSLVDQYVDFGYATAKVDQYNPQNNISYPLVVFYLEFIKGGIRKILIIFLPLFVIFFLGLLSLAINIKMAKIYTTISVGSLSALLFYRFVIESITPRVGYFTISDKIYLSILITSFITFLSNIVLARYTQKRTISEAFISKLRLIRSIMFYFFIFLITISSAYFIIA